MPIIGTIASSTRQGLSTTAWESIASFTGTGSGGTATFSSIPSTYTHLQLRVQVQSDANNGGITMRYNSDSGANYSHSYMSGGTSNSVTSAGFTSISQANGFDAMPTNPNWSNDAPMIAIVDIYDYKDTSKFKTSLQTVGQVIGSTSGGASNSFAFVGNTWRNTSAIDTITFVLAAGNFTTRSRISLYGIKV